MYGKLFFHVRIVCRWKHSFTALTILFIHVSATVASCVRGATATEVITRLRVRLNGVNIEELTAYSQDGTVAHTGPCTTTTVKGDVIELALTFDTGALTCGVEQVRFLVKFDHVDAFAV